MINPNQSGKFQVNNYKHRDIVEHPTTKEHYTVIEHEGILKITDGAHMWRFEDCLVLMGEWRIVGNWNDADQLGVKNDQE